MKLKSFLQIAESIFVKCQPHHASVLEAGLFQNWPCDGFVLEKTEIFTLPTQVYNFVDCKMNFR